MYIHEYGVCIYDMCSPLTLSVSLSVPQSVCPCISNLYVCVVMYIHEYGVCVYVICVPLSLFLFLCLSLSLYVHVYLIYMSVW